MNRRNRFIMLFAVIGTMLLGQAILASGQAQDGASAESELYAQDYPIPLGTSSFAGSNGLSDGADPTSPRARATRPARIISTSPGVDLVVESIALDPTDPDPGQPVSIAVTILNQGDTVASGFYTYLYIDPTNEPPDLSTPDTSYTYMFSLNAGQSYEWSYTDHTFDASCHSIWVWVDRGNDVSEDNEGNNLSHIEVCVGQQCTPDIYEQDDTCDDALDISIDGVSQLHNLCPVGDVDWVKFQATEGVTYTINATPLGDDAEIVLSLYDTCGGQPGFGTGARLVWQALAGGTYYIEVKHHDSTYGPETDYELSVTAGTSCPGDNYEPDDTCSTARDIPTDGTRQTHLFCNEDDEDWVKFTAHSGHSYLIVADNPGPDAEPILALHDTCAGLPPFGHGQQIAWTASVDGVYYVQVLNHDPSVYGPTTHYDLRIEDQSGCSADAYEDDDTFAQAKVIDVDGAAQHHDFCPEGDRDWSAFQVTAGVQYTLETANLAAQSDTVLCLYDTDGATLIRCNDDGGPGWASRIVWQCPSDGTYYAQVTHYSDRVSGPDTAYDLLVTAGQTCRPDAYEQDDVPGEASVIDTDGSPQDHNFCPAGDGDWAKFVASVGTAYSIQTINLGPACDTMLSLYDTDQTSRLAFNDDYGQGLDSRIDYVFARAGTYYVKVEHYDANQYVGLWTMDYISPGR